MHSEKKSKVHRCKKCPESSIPCEHLEKKLPKPYHRNIKMKLKHRTNYQLVNKEHDTEFEAKCRRLETALLNMGIERFRVEILMDRHVSGLSWSEIARLKGYQSVSTVVELDRETLEILRSTGRHFIKQLLGDLN